ncbi:DUF3800 domain-containing protein [Brevundimonas sp. KM4]|uniref:DUF3800 domain-containing protein n=1 Tax=Brevundimonas sp. KM4 TaxID=1628191 RepID=UPI0009E472E9|nr:DUF3800 domain-containing protein [Brevundimonas sp. KM4]
MWWNAYPFVDESGTAPRPQDTNSRYFVIGGIIIPETSWARMRDGLMGIKIRRQIRGEIKWRYFAPQNDDARNPMRGMAMDDRNSIREEIYKLMASEVAVRTIACVASREGAYAIESVKTQADLYHGTFKPVTERFQYHLNDVGKISGRKEWGIVVGDHRGANDDKRLRSYHEQLLHSNSGTTSNYKNLIEGLFLHPSNLSIGIQLADMVAGAIWRKFERNDDQYYEMLKPSLRKNAQGSEDGYGVVKFPTRGFI